MGEPAIVVRDLSKTYHVPEREPGLKAALGGLVKRTYQDVTAVCDANFSLEPGEMVGFIGPNGAGKTTTLKMLSGLLLPSSGKASVLGFTPGERKSAFLKQISMVMGNKSQMIWDIPPMDSFRVLGEIYNVPADERKRTEDELFDLLEMRELLTRPVRNLSLGERMKCELVAGLIHKPKVLFLDEPTLGLDVSIQRRVREFLREYNRKSGITVLLTSHYMADVMALCPRVILIHMGRLLYDGELNGLAKKIAPFKLLKVTLGADTHHDLQLPDGVEVIERDNENLSLRVPRNDAPALTSHLLQHLPVIDLIVADPPIEAVIDQVYQEGSV